MTASRRQVVVLATIGLAAAAGGALLGVVGQQAQSGAAELLRHPYADLHGHPLRLREWRGRVLLCNFWATWCEPCREEVPLLVSTQREYGPKSVQIVGIGMDTAAKLRDFADRYAINYPVVLGDPETPDVMRKLGNTAAALPFSVILDARQRIVYRKLGALKVDELRRELAGLIG